MLVGTNRTMIVRRLRMIPVKKYLEDMTEEEAHYSQSRHARV
jgi:hypothetical protein